MKSSSQGDHTISLVQLVLPGLVMFSSIGLFATVSYTVFSAAAQAHDASNALQTKLNAEEELSATSELASQTSAERGKMFSYVVPQNGSVAVISEIEDLGKTANADASVVAINVKPPKDVTPGTLTLSVTFDGTFAACMHFVRLLETIPFGSSILSLQLQYDGSSKKWDGTISLSVVSFDIPS